MSEHGRLAIAKSVRWGSLNGSNHIYQSRVHLISVSPQTKVRVTGTFAAEHELREGKSKVSDGQSALPGPQTRTCQISAQHHIQVIPAYRISRSGERAVTLQLVASRCAGPTAARSPKHCEARHSRALVNDSEERSQALGCPNRNPAQSPGSKRSFLSRCLAIQYGSSNPCSALLVTELGPSACQCEYYLTARCFRCYQ